MLEDVLTRGLRLVVCGTAVGPKSAAVGEYYAGRGNKFWRTMATTGLTSYEFKPSEYKSLLRLGIGLTDIAKEIFGLDCDLPRGSYDRVGLRRKIESYEPRHLCFNGKRAAKVFLDRNNVDFGPQAERIGQTRLWVAPSTSGAANAYWDLAVWQELAKLVQSSTVQPTMED